MKRAIIMFTALCLFSDLTAAIFGGEPYEVFDQGGINYFVFGNSLIDDQETLYGETTNRQGDTCLLESSQSLDVASIPDDAIVYKAYLVWMGTVDPEKLADPTDNTVHLKFAREDGYTYEEDIVAGDTPKKIGDASDLFEFESLKYTADINTGCTETEPGQPGTAELAYFTYRTDITPFFNKLFDDNRTATAPVMDGVALHGSYTVSSLDCTDHDYFKCRTLMVSNWSILLLYRSGMFGRKKIFLYPGLVRLQGERSVVTLAGLELQKVPQIRISMVASEGDSGLLNPLLPPEMLYLRGQNGAEDYPLVDNCSEDENSPVEVWDSYASFTSLEASSKCMKHVDTPSFALDIDTFHFDAAEDPLLSAQFQGNDPSFDLIVSTNQDDILTNFLVLEVDIKESCFDIPGEDELLNCVCYPEKKDVFCGGEPQYIQINVENWGDAEADLVYVQAEYDTLVFDYVPDTTEIATEFDENENGINWKKILDGPEGAFPLSEPNLIVNTLQSFQTDPWHAESYLIRFRLLPKTGLEKNRIGEIRAAISDDQSLYYTNTNIPLTLFPGECAQTCTLEELKKKCGGLSPDDPDIFNPGNDADALTDSDELLNDETPDATVDETPESDPESTHPMENQTPGCSLTML